MAKKKKKFIALFESVMTRMTRGGFLIGDVFKFNDNFKTHESYKNLGRNVQDMIDQMIDSGLHIVVVGIKNNSPTIYPGSSETSSLHVTLDIALDNMGGRFTHYCSIPADLGQPMDFDPNLSPIPDGVRRKDKVTIKPEEVTEDEENLSNKVDRGDGKLVQGQIRLPKKNTQIPSKAITPSPAVNTQMKEYLKGLE